MSLLRGMLLGIGTNYLKVVCRAGCGLIGFRLLRESLDDSTFGFWNLLWSTFGFMVLLDFGLGYTIAKAVAQAGPEPDAAARRSLRRAFASVFWLGVGVTALMAAALFGGGEGAITALLAKSAIHDPAAQRPLVAAAALFAGGLLISYPLGLFREVLRARQRLHVANLIEIAAILAQTAGIAWGCQREWPLVGFMAVAVSCTVLPVSLIALLVMRDHDLRPYPTRFSREHLSALGAFSIFAYLNTLGGIVAYRSDAVLIGSLLSLPAVAWFASGQRLTEVYAQFTQQIQATLGPAAAQLAVHGEPAQRAEALRRLLLVSQRWVVLVGASLIVPLVLGMDGALRLLNGDATLVPASTTVAWLLLASTFCGLLGGSSSKEVLLMTGHHRAMLAITLAEAAAKVALSSWLLLRYQSILGAALGSLIPSVAINLLVIPAYTRRAFGLRLRWVLLAWLRGLAGAFGAIASGCAWFAWRPLGDPVRDLVAGCAVVAIGMLPGWWWLGMTADERVRVGGWRNRLVGMLRKAPRPH